MSNKNPYINALLAGLYIVLIGLGLQATAGMKIVQGTIFLPMFMLTLFVISAAIMGYLFVFHPLTLYFDGKRKEAVREFFKTLASFALWLVLFGSIILLR